MRAMFLHRWGLHGGRWLAVVAAVGAASVLPACGSSSSSTSPSTTPSTLAGPHVVVLNPTVFAKPPHGATNPDDITLLNGMLYVTYQNNAGKDGTPAGSMSTIAAFDQHSGALVTTYSVVGRWDGLTADSAHGRLLASVNEDLNSSLYVITPGTPTPAHYTYTPSPAETGSDGTNGGTDAISIGADGTIYIAHSNPESMLPPPGNTAAVYTMTLSGATAMLTPLFGVNDTASVVNPVSGGPASEPLGLTDPDSNRFVAALNGGTLIQDAQADSKLVLASNLSGGKPTLAGLKLTNFNGDPKVTPQLDDIERIGGTGTLFAVDQAFGNVLAIPMTSADAGVFVVSQPKPATGDLANTPALGVVDLTTGVVTPRNFLLGSPKGLLFVKS
jgi:hypothetical protein